ncbi:DUF362 domain-containing protein [Candidatus Fermentibacteria bacterium]|nr:DUF362 domain-containing protein [Candidatus Fermentibacteria bacterium]
MNRRSFVHSLSSAALVGAFHVPCDGGTGGRPSGALSPDTDSTVVIVRRVGLSQLKGDGRTGAYRTLLEEAFSTLGKTSLAQRVSGRNTIGLKANCLAGRPLSPSPELAQALSGMLRDVGVREVTVWERTMRELTRAGFTARGSFTIIGTDAVGYGRTIYESGDVGSLLSNALLNSDGLVSVGMLKDHDLAGISCVLKNLYGTIHNPNKYHDYNCNPYVAHVASLPPIRERLVLSVLDCATAQCHGGPSYKPAWAWPFDGILVSFDPVAADRIAADLIEDQRAIRELPTLEADRRPPRWIETAGLMGLGEHRRDAITVREVIV